MYCVNRDLSEEGVRVLLFEKKTQKLRGYHAIVQVSPNIFKKSNFDYYIERPSVRFRNEKYSVLNKFCHAECLAYYTIENK